MVRGVKGDSGRGRGGGGAEELEGLPDEGSSSS